MPGRSSSPPFKRIKLEVADDYISLDSDKYIEVKKEEEVVQEEEEEEDGEQCSICLQNILDRTIVPTCSHEFCFECVLIWTEQSRRCPLCTQPIGEYLIHDIRSKYDYRKYYLPPPRSSPEQSVAIVNRAHTTRRRRRTHQWGRRPGMGDEEADKLDRSILKRKWIYKNHLYAKHIASNAYTKYRPYPTPFQFAASPDLTSRTTSFLRRELQVWENMDVEFLTTFIISLMKSIDIRSDSAVKLLAEFLDIDTPHLPGIRFVNAEHFAHEIYSYVRSPYKDLFVYDSVVQYDTPPELEETPDEGSHSHRRAERNEEPSQFRQHSLYESYEPSTSRGGIEDAVDRSPRGTREQQSPVRNSGNELVESSQIQTSLLSPLSDGESRRDEKGKGKAGDDPVIRDNSVLVEVEPSSNVSPAEEIENVKVAESSRTSRTQSSTSILDKRKTRHRTLHDSVYAHLTLPSRRSSLHIQHAINDDAPLASDVTTNDPVNENPSLLLRLSELSGTSLSAAHASRQPASFLKKELVELQNNNKERRSPSGVPDARIHIDGHATHQFAVNPSLTPNTARKKDNGLPSDCIVSGQAESFDLGNADGAPNSPLQPNSYPGTTLAGMAEPHTGKFAKSATSTPVARSVQQSSPPRASAVDDVQVEVDDKNTHASLASSTTDSPISLGNSIKRDAIHQIEAPPWDPRTRLLFRLEQERQEAVNRTALASRPEQPTVKTGLPGLHLPIADAENLDKHLDLEARLRTRALLRKKIASLKQDMEGGSSSSSSSTSNR